MIYPIKVRLFLGILFCIQLNMLMAQDDVLRRADSLFVQQKYTEALAKYDQIYELGEISSAMLLKMAFIQDGLGNYAEALFYLDHYFQQSTDREVIVEIEELAEENELEGYHYDDIDYFIALYSNYQNHIALALGSLMILLFTYMFKKQKAYEKPISAGMVQTVVIIIFFIVINFKPSKKGIIISDQTLLRSNPSAGGEPIDFIKKGHKVEVLGVDKVWVKIVWDGREVFVRNSRIKLN